MMKSKKQKFKDKETEIQNLRQQMIEMKEWFEEKRKELEAQSKQK